MKSNLGWSLLILVGLVLLVAPGVFMLAWGDGYPGMMGGYYGGMMMGRSFGFMNPYVMLLTMLLPIAAIPVLVIGTVGLVVNLFKMGQPAQTVSKPVGSCACANCGKPAQAEWATCPYCGKPLS